MHEIEDCPQRGFAYHIANPLGQITDQHDRVVPGVQLTEDARVINDYGEILPGFVYTQDGILLSGSLKGMEVKSTPEKELIEKGKVEGQQLTEM